MTNLIYGSVSGFCTKESCPRMTAGVDYEYLWIDPPKFKKAVGLPAKEYIDCLMTWIEKKVNNEKLFPSEQNQPFPHNFMLEVKSIFKRLFRVYSHIYHTHFARIEELGEIGHLNTAFKHFMFFVFEYELIRPRELVPLKETIILLLGEEYSSKFKKKKKRRKRKQKKQCVKEEVEEKEEKRR